MQTRKRANTRTSIVVGAVAIGIASIWPGVAFTGEAEQFELRMQRYTGTEENALFEDWVQRLEDATDGRITVNMHLGGELVPNSQMLAAVRSGTLDVAYGYGGYWGGQMSVGVIEAGIPGAWTSVDQAKELWDERGFQELLEEQYGRMGVKYTVPIFGGAYNLLTEEPVTTLDEMRELRIRATGPVATVLEQFDISTTAIPVEEFYVAMSTGSIDGLIYGGPYDYSVLDLDEVATQYTRLNMLYPGFVDNIIVNQDTWDEMPEDLQDTFIEVTRDWAQDRHQNFVEQNEAQADKFTIHELRAEDKRAITEAAQVAWENEAEKSEAAARAIEMIRELAREHGRLDE